MRNEIKGREDTTAPLGEALKLPAHHEPCRAPIAGPPAPFAG